METTWSVPFIGRSDELEAIRTHAYDWGTRRIIFISGQGGIGKTRLLNEIERDVATGDEKLALKILPIVDFDEEQYHFAQNIGVMISRQLDRTAFDPYFEAIRKLRLVEESRAKQGEPTPLVQRQILAIDRRFVECFNQVSRKQRVIIRVDTTDDLQDTGIFRYIHDMGMQLSNVLIVAAGRNAHHLYDVYKKDWGQDALHLPLQPFQIEDSRTYLEEKLAILHVTLDRAWMDKLFILAGGLPVLIDLAIEWAQNHRPLPWLEELSAAELQELQRIRDTDEQARQRLADLLEEFKKVVVLPIADLHTKLDYLKFLLSKVYPLDVEGIMEMLNLSRQEAEQLIHKAQKSVAVKVLPDGRLKLHDEVQRLVNKYVWPLLDHNREWEMRDSRRAIAYLSGKSESLLREVRRLKEQEARQIESPDPASVLRISGERSEKESLFWSLRIERLRHQLAIDVQKGYELFQQDDELSREESPGRTYRLNLLETISPYADLEEPKEDIQGQRLQEAQRLSIQQLLAREAGFIGQYRKAAEIYEQLLRRIPKESQEYVKTLNGQANQFVRAGKLREALRVNEEALRLSQEFNYQRWIVQSTLEIGWVYRLMGNLGQAVQYYNNALKLAYQHDDDKRIALIYNNLAYVHGLQHQENAVNEIQQAIRLWKKLAQEREENRFRLGQCYNIAGEIYLEMECPEDSLAYFELSWNIFNREEVESGGQESPVAEWRSKARSGRGFAYWHLAVSAFQKEDHETAQQHLGDALKDLQWAAEYAAHFDSPLIHNRLGEVWFLLKNYEAAKRVWLESLHEARQVGDAFQEFHSLTDLTRLALYHPLEEFPDWKAFETYYNRNYRRHYQSPHFEILVGLFYTYLGHLAFRHEERSEALRFYERGLPVLSEHGTYPPFNLISQLDFVEQEILPQVSKDCVREVANHLREYWLSGMFDMLAFNYFRRWSHWEETGAEHSGGDHV